ncbi:MAG: LuxR family transcriptional regulator [Rhodobacteraceae bacterium]|nr:LuxR family transcriptional regulator [Paracoccaceae bacterium]
MGRNQCRCCLTDVYRLISTIAEATSVDTAWSLASGFISQFGFSRINYGIARFRDKSAVGDLDASLYLTTAEADYARAYFQGGFYSQTAAFRWTLNNVGSTTWAWIDAAYRSGNLPPQEAAAVRQNLERGISAGVTISFPVTAALTKGAMGLIADVGLDHPEVEAIWAHEGEKIRAVAHVMHLRILNLPGSTRARTLTQRQREVLEHVARGKTAQEVAIILQISVAMVEKHLRLARETLNVDNTAQAVTKAALLNMILHDLGR